jgi:hypothetical protein
MSLVTEVICDDRVPERVPTSLWLRTASRRCGSGLQARPTSLAGHSLLGMSEPLVVFPFRYRDARTGRWVRARYKAKPEEIAVRYVEWEIVGAGEERRPVTGYFNPGRREGE